MKAEEKETKPRYGIALLERRKYRRFPIRLPIEYYRVDSPISQTAQVLGASEGGLQIFFRNRWRLVKN